MGTMKMVEPARMRVSTGAGVEKSSDWDGSTGVRLTDWEATLSTDLAATSCLAPTTWQAIPFMSDSFGARAFPVGRSRHSILTGAACWAAAAPAKHTNTRTLIVVFKD